MAGWKKRTAALLGLIAAGCIPAGWVKPGATDADFRSDLDTCYRGDYLTRDGRHIASTEPGTDLGIAGSAPSDAGMLGQYLSECLDAKGWKQGSR